MLKSKISAKVQRIIEIVADAECHLIYCYINIFFSHNNRKTEMTPAFMVDCFMHTYTYIYVYLYALFLFMENMECV